MQPKPMAETSKLPFPSFRFCICSVVVSRPNLIRAWPEYRLDRERCSRGRAHAVAILRKRRSAALQGTTKLCGRHTDSPPKDLRKMARAGVPDLKCDLDKSL